MAERAHLLLMEDDPILGYALQAYLEMEGYAVTWEKDGRAGLARFEAEPFDLCLIDVMMPAQNGFAVAEALRAHPSEVPFLFLTARGLKVDKLKGFRLGADDYLVKPVDEEELIARIEVILRRHRPQPAANETPAQIDLGHFVFHPATRRLVGDGQTIELTEKESRLLELLCQRQGQLLERDSALRAIWGKSDYFNRRSMDVHLARLRKHLRVDPRVSINNIHGRGFILEVKEE